jgi:hypothetical protein
MGHSNNKIMQSYMSSVVGIDTQSIVLGRPQQKDFIESHTSMMSGRQLLAPKPPGAQLTDASIRNKFGFTAKKSTGQAPVAIADLSPTQQYQLRRQSRKRMYSKERQEFFKDGLQDSRRTELSTCLSRSPSRYLQALLKHEPDRQQIAMLSYPDVLYADEVPAIGESLRLDQVDSPAAPLDGSEKSIPLKNLVDPLARIASPGRARYTYRGAEPSQDHRCTVCNDDLQL